MYIYILGVFTEKSYSKPLARNVVYIPIIILNHATSHDHSSLQSDWTSATSWRHWRCSVISRKTACKCFPASILAFTCISETFCQRFDWNECKYKQWTQFFWCLSKCKLHWVAGKVFMSPFGVHSLCTIPNLVYSGSLAKFSWTPSGFIHFARDPI